MRSIFLNLALLFSLSSSSPSQFLPVSIFSRIPPGCQYPSASEGTYIYFTHPNEPFHYSISTPWTRFYPDALRADLAEQGFQIGIQHGQNNNMCGWTTADAVKIGGWLRGRISYRHVPGGVKVVQTSKESHSGNHSAPLNHTRRTYLTAEEHVSNTTDFRGLYLTRPAHSNLTGSVVFNSLPHLDGMPDVDLPDTGLPDVDDSSSLNRLSANATQKGSNMKIHRTISPTTPVRRHEYLTQTILADKSPKYPHNCANSTTTRSNPPSRIYRNCLTQEPPHPNTPPSDLSSTLPPHLHRRQSPQPQPPPSTLHQIHQILATNSPKDDILYMTIQVGAPIIGVVALVTLLLLLMRHISHKLYPDPDADGETADIELGSLGKSPSVKSDRTLVNVEGRAATPTRGAGLEEPANVKTPLWRRVVGKSVERRRDSGVGLGEEDGRPVAQTEGGEVGVRGGREEEEAQVQMPVEAQMGGAAHSPRQSSSVYSRSVDGFTVYPERFWGR